MKLFKTNILLLISLMLSSGCSQYLDVVPDDIAEVGMAFNMQATAERYLSTCYSWMPAQGNITANPAFTAGDELWYSANNEGGPWGIAQGWQGVVYVYNNYWDGGPQAKAMYQGIRDCNIFIDNIQSVPDMSQTEKDRWEAEVKFLKAYYHFWLLRMYGPIHIVDRNLPISASVEEVKLHRKSIDECIDYIVASIDDAIPALPDDIIERTTEAGRISKVIAKSIKAYVLVTAASPLFNGNTAYAHFLNENQQPYFNQQPDPAKWQRAYDATKEAIELAEKLGYKLYTHQQEGVSQFDLTPATISQLSTRGALAERWNQETIWANPNSTMDAATQGHFMGHVNPQYSDNWYITGRFAPTLKMAHLFYSKNGVPIDEDLHYDYEGRFQVRTVDGTLEPNLLHGYRTASLHFGRENRFYASLGFDGGLWYGHGRYDDKNPWNIQAKWGQFSGPTGSIHYSATGYFAKKIPHFQSIIGTVGNYTARWYAWPEMRLTNLYLLYAEAANEAHGPGADAYKYLDLLRERALLGGVVESWQQYSNQPNKPLSKEGLRAIIQQERGIELAFEAQRFWDLRRWNTAAEELNEPIQGWNIRQSTVEAYYQVNTLFNRSFAFKDYFWPLEERTMQINKNLTQNPGW